MNRLWRRGAPRAAAGRVPARRGPAVYGVTAALMMVVPLTQNPHVLMPAPAPAPPRATVAVFHQIILPDLAVIDPGGLGGNRLARIRKIPGVRNVLALDGAELKVRGRRVNVVGVNAQRYRSWTPLRTASSQRLWTALAEGDFVSSGAARHMLKLHPGDRYRLPGATSLTLAYGGGGALGVAGIDVVVSSRYSGRLGLIHDVAALVSAPGLTMSALKSEVRAAAGRGARVISLRPAALPVTRASSPGRPSTYLQLFQKSAARYCPGLSWTVLAAIGQIESGDGANNGPSSAGALGPMQFLPSTWKLWGITAFGQPGRPNIMDPYDAVPSAARYLCAAGAGAPGGLPGAIYAYNHASWYVRAVLALAQEYARRYPARG